MLHDSNTVELKGSFIWKDISSSSAHIFILVKDAYKCVDVFGI